MSVQSEVEVLQIANSSLDRGADYESSAMSVKDASRALSARIVCRFTSPLDYANAEVLMNEVLELIGSARFALQECVLTFDLIQEVDYVAAKMLTELADRLEAKRVRLLLAHISPEVEAFLLSMGVLSTPVPDGS